MIGAEGEAVLPGEAAGRAARGHGRLHGTSLLEGLLTRGDRRVARVLEQAWRNGARLDGWRENFEPQLWRDAVAACGVDFDWFVHRHRPTSEVLPWDHVNVKKGREYLVKEQNRSLLQLEVMAAAK